MTTGTNNTLGMLVSQVCTTSVSANQEKKQLKPDSVGCFSNILGSNVAISTKKEIQNNFSESDVKVQTPTEVKVDNRPEIDETVSEKKGADANRNSQIADKVKTVGNKVKEVIADELDISIEDVQMAMELLQLTTIDLIEPKNIVERVTKLNEVQDTMTLVLSDELNSILGQISEIFNQLTNELNISLDELKTAIEWIDSNEISYFLAMEEPEVLNGTVNEQSKEQVFKTVKSDVNIVEVINTIDTKQFTEQNEKPVKEADVNYEITVLDSKEGEAGITVSNDDLNQTEDDSKAGFFDKSSGFETVRESKSRTAVGADDNISVFSVAQEPKTAFIPQTDTIELPSGETVKVQDMIDQVVEQAKLFTSSEHTTLEMTLNPEGLGKIFMEITQKGDEVTAKLFAQNEAVKQALESQMATLKLDMNSSGTKVTSIEVSVATHEFEKNLEEGQQNPNDESQKENNPNHRRRNIDFNSLDELTGLMSEEELLVAQIMKDNGNTLNYQA